MGKKKSSELSAAKPVCDPVEKPHVPGEREQKSQRATFTERQRSPVVKPVADVDLSPSSRIDLTTTLQMFKNRYSSEEFAQEFRNAFYGLKLPVWCGDHRVENVHGLDFRIDAETSRIVVWPMIGSWDQPPDAFSWKTDLRRVELILGLRVEGALVATDGTDSAQMTDRRRPGRPPKVTEKAIKAYREARQRADLAVSDAIIARHFNCDEDTIRRAEGRK